MKSAIVLLIALLSSGFAEAGAAQTAQQNPTRPGVAPAGDPAHETSAPSARAVWIDGGIRIDGRLDEAVWARATPITEFIQLNPLEGQAASERTEVRFLYDADALYVGAWLHDSGPVSTVLVRRDAQASDSDWFEVALDTYHDHLTQSTFAVNPSGVRRDMTGAAMGGPGGGGGGGGSEWNPVWEVATAVTDSGWVAELRIPFSQLRFAREDVQIWGLQISRTIARKQEVSFFAHIPRNQPRGPARFGHLEGLEGLEARNPLEITPYLSGRADLSTVPRNAAVDFENPFRSGRDVAGGIGADLQYRISSNFTLNATINPDFGQVEVDPAVINLTALETRLQENRPFFVEGADIFRFGGVGGGGGGEGGGGGGGGGQLLYTRRIGRAPSLGAPQDAAYIKMPDAAAILGAGKLSGRTSNGWSLGLLEAVTSKEWAPYVDSQNFQREAVVEPLSNYLTARAKRDFNGGASTVGGIFTSVYRRLEGENMQARLRSAAYTGGVDFRHEWANRSWSIFGQVSPSYIAGSGAVMIAAQTSSARYFDRPDADHLAVDSTATSLMGYAASVDVGKRAGDFTGSVGVSATSPMYEINDLGFQTVADRIALSTRFNYRQSRPGNVFRNWGVGTGPRLTWNYGGDVIAANAGLSLNGQLLNYWGGHLSINRQFSALNDRITRGGPLSRDPGGSSVGFGFNSDQRRPYTILGFLSAGRDDSGASSHGAGFNIGLRPAPNWEVRIGPYYARNQAMAQYVQTESDATATHTFGRRYVFGELDQHTVSLETRLNMTFTPNLSFELYAQPLISSGDYGQLKELQTPRTFDFVRYGIDAGSTMTTANAGRYSVDPDGSGPAREFTVANRDFNTRSLRGNAVLRWEWRPGSTLFLVWQQSRSEALNALATDPAFQRIGSFDIGRDARDLFGLRPDNLFMVKVTYWLNP